MWRRHDRPSRLHCLTALHLLLNSSCPDLRSVLDMEAARQAIRAALPPGGPTADSPVLVYWKDSLTVRRLRRLLV